MRRKITIEILSGLLILLFAYTAIRKLVDFESFRDTLKLIPHLGEYNFIIALGLPVIELIIALLLLLPRYRIAGLFASLVMLVVFTGYIGYLLTFKQNNLPCSCGGVIRQMTFRQHILFNLFFIIISLIALLISFYSTSLQQTGSKLKTWQKSKRHLLTPKTKST